MAAAPAPKLLQVERSGPIPVVSIQIHEAQFGSYVIGLWNKRGRAFRVGMGDTDDDAPNTSASGAHRIVRTRDQLQQLDGFEISVVIAIQAFETKPGARWSYDFEVSQGDRILTSEQKSGPVTQRLLTHSKRYRIRLG